MRRIAIAIVGLAAAIALYRLCVVPWRANEATKLLEATTQRALAGDPAAVALLTDAANLASARAWRTWTPHDANLNISVASALSLSGQVEEAMRIYDEALRYDRRPEMYFNRAGLKLRRNDVAGAIEDFVYAARFNPTLVNQIRTEAIRTVVARRVDDLRSRGNPSADGQP